MKRYIDNYNEFRKETSRLPVVPLTYENKHRRQPNEIIVNLEEETIYGVDSDLELLPLGKNMKIIRTTVKLDYDTRTVPIGTTLKKGDKLLVSQNGMILNENTAYIPSTSSIRSVGDEYWQCSFEETTFQFTIFRTQMKDVPPEYDVYLPSDGKVGQVLIRTNRGIAWANLDITDDQYNDIIIDSLGKDFMMYEPTTDRDVSFEHNLPDEFPDGNLNQVLVIHDDGISWMDVDITTQALEDSITGVTSYEYTVIMNKKAPYEGLDTVEIPEILPIDGEDGQILFKTESGVAWKDIEMTTVQYRLLASSVFGNYYV